MIYLSRFRLNQAQRLVSYLIKARQCHGTAMHQRTLAKHEESPKERDRLLTEARVYLATRDEHLKEARTLYNHLWELTNDDDLITQEYWQVQAEAWDHEDPRVLWVRTENKSQLIEALEGTGARFRRISTAGLHMAGANIGLALDYYLPEKAGALRDFLLLNQKD